MDTLIQTPTFSIPSNIDGKSITFDISYVNNQIQKPVLIFIHGFKGFKDWGHFPLISSFLAQSGYFVLKMNFSHNGTSLEQLSDFVDLEGFGNNNFSKELENLNLLISYVQSDSFVNQYKNNLNEHKIHLVGHSKGGATVLIQTIEDPRIHSAATLASVTNIITRYSEDEDQAWKKNGVKYVFNGRTNQNMPLYYQLSEDIQKNRDRYDILKHLNTCSKPILLLHAKDDEAVHWWESDAADKAALQSSMVLYEDGGHTFGGFHPYTETTMPPQTEVACKAIVLFFKSLRD